MVKRIQSGMFKKECPVYDFDYEQKITLLQEELKFYKDFILKGLNIKTSLDKAVPPFRVGKKQKRAILDSNGHELGIFSTGSEQMAALFCEFLNQSHKNK